MPNYCNVDYSPRRSRRLSHQEPKCYDEDGFEYYDPEVITRFFSEPNLSSCSTAAPDEPLSISIAKPHTDSPPPKSSHSRRRDEAHIPRPPNAFILFRSDFWERQKDDPIEKDHRQISRLAANLWKEASPGIREYYRKQAITRKKEHAVQYPNYKYAPGVRRTKAVRRKSPQDKQAEIDRCEELASRLIRGQQLEIFGNYHSYSPSTRETSALVKAESPQPLPHRDLEASPCLSIKEFGEERSSESPSDDRYILMYPDAPEVFATEGIPCDQAPEERSSESPSDDRYILMYPDAPEVFATEGIPCDLAPSKAMESEVAMASYHEGPQPPSYNRVDSQFGFKPQVYHVQESQIMLSDSAFGYDEFDAMAEFSAFHSAEEITEYSLFKPEELRYLDLLSISGYTSSYQTQSYGHL